MATIELSTQDPDDFDALYGELRGVRGIELRADPAAVEPGEQGAGSEVLIAVLSSGGSVAVLLGIVKSLLESRRPGFVLKIRHGATTVEITADTLEDALPVLEELLGGA